MHLRWGDGEDTIGKRCTKLLVVDAERRRCVLADNVGLVGGFLRDQTTTAFRAWYGGTAELKADLYEAYVFAVDSWLRDARGCQLSTFVYKGLRWNVSKLAARASLIRGGPRPLFFHGSEGRCETERLLYRERPADLFDLRNLVRSFLRDLDARRQWIITVRFGLDGEPAWTLRETAEALGISHERVRSIENHVLFQGRDRLLRRPGMHLIWPGGKLT